MSSKDGEADREYELEQDALGRDEDQVSPDTLEAIALSTGVSAALMSIHLSHKKRPRRNGVHSSCLQAMF